MDGQEHRTRKMSERGFQYAKDQRSKKVESTYKQLLRTYDSLRTVMEENSISRDRLEKIRLEYASWLKLYGNIFEFRSEYSTLLNETEQMEFDEVCKMQDVTLTALKSTFEQFFLLHGSVQQGSESSVRSSAVSSKKKSVISRNSSSVKSSVSSAVLHEKQVQAELQAKVKALKEKQELDKSKLELKMKEEELELKTQIHISEAKSKVLHEYECDRLRLSGDSEEQVPRQLDGNIHNVLNIDMFTSPETQGMKLQPHKQVSFKPPSSHHYFHNQNVANSPSLYPDLQEQPVVSPLYPNLHDQPVGISRNIDVIHSVVQQLRKPPPNIMQFSGDPLEYQRFKRQFQVNIVANSDSIDERMSYLEQFTDGEALRIVKGYSYLDACRGYEAAWKELDDRYGDDEAIASALVKRALNWPNVKLDNPKALDDYAIFLQECMNAVSAINAVKILEYPDNLRKLVMKLPFSYQEKWRNVLLHVRNSGRFIEFQDLVEFVKCEARKAMDPMFGKEALKFEEKGNSAARKAQTSARTVKKSSFGTGVQKQSQRQAESNLATPKIKTLVKQSLKEHCIYCNECSHSLNVCKKIIMKPHAERLSFLKLKGLCFKCLQPGHMSKGCDQLVACSVCKGNHQSILHVDRNSEVKALSACAELSEDAELYTEAGNTECTLAVIPVKVAYKNGLAIESTYAFLDPGSTVSFCSEALMNRLGCSGKKMEITIDTMGQPHTSFVQAINGIHVYDLELKNTVAMPTVYSRDYIPVSNKYIPTSMDVSHWPHLADIDLPQVDAKVELLIGANVPDAYSPQEVRTGPPGSPHASKTLLGWILWNVIRSTEDKENRFPSMKTEIMNTRLEDFEGLDKMVKESMNFDFPERHIDDHKEMSQEDKAFMKIVSESIKKKEGHYEIKLPFRKEELIMPDNSEQAMKRLDSLKRKLKKNTTFHEDYKTFMKSILDKGYAEKVPANEVEGQKGKVWYIPHHGVYHPRKPKKIRVVFDCTASYHGISLNNMLLQGPNLTSTLLGVLLRFRQDNIAVMADIESMYYQVRVQKNDIDLLRFYWWPEGDYTENPEAYRMLVHLFGAVSSASCATFALQQVARDNQQDHSDQINNMLKDNFYVDDFLASVPTTTKAVEVVTEVTELCQRGGFRLTKWISNDSNLLKSIPIEERAKDVKQLNLDCESLPSERALGVYWFVQTDCLGFKIQLKEKPATKRGILSIVSSIYDPIGLMSPFVLKAKQLLQFLHINHYGWDDDIDEASQKKWKTWQLDLPKLEDIEIRRCYKPENFGSLTSCQLHLFSDASDVGYGVAAYLRLENDHGNTYCILVMAKSRVAPLKKITMPRMELTAATLAVRLSAMIKKELQYDLEDTVYWTDSMSVLKYISNTTTRFQTFVANRIAVIHDSTTVDQWRYVDTKLNPADYASRGINLNSSKQIAHWLEGPAFLWESTDCWPKGDVVSVVPMEDDPEVKHSVSCALVLQENVFDKLLNHFSSWIRLKRAVGWLILVTRELKHRCTKDNCMQKSVWLLSADVLQEAETLLIKHVQRQHFSEEFNILNGKGKPVTKTVKKTSVLYRLDPYMQEGIIKVGGRLHWADISSQSKHPIVLPKGSRLSIILVSHAHVAVGHLGKNAVLSYLTEKFWIIGARSLIKSQVAKCVICRKYQGRPGQQKMADLPAERLTPDLPPFSNVGVDYFGPISIKRGRSYVKRYGVLFTCMAVRAIHLEVSCSLDTDSCINAVRRFIARRGPPKTIHSDNGTNLVGCERELRKSLTELNHYKLHSSLANEGIVWHFNPPSASHYGGIWERMIRTVRKVMYSLMQEQVVKLDDESLYTLFCEIEAIVNGRPITDLPCSPSDLSPLTPNHLLHLRPGEIMPPGTFTKDDLYSKRRWRQVQYLADIFWKRWRKEYLPLLQERQKWNVCKRNLKIGDLVLIMDNSPRNAWTLGRVTEILMDRKNLVRTVKVRTANTELTRPIDKLCFVMEETV